MKTLFTLLLAAFAFAAQADEGRDFALDVPADKIDQLELEANVGEVRIRAADIDVVEVRVRLEPGDDWFSSSERLARRLEDASLEHSVSGDRLHLRLDYEDGRGDDDDLEERWEIRLPARLALNVDLNVGSMRIEGTAGALEVEVNVGELDVDVKGGDIDAEVNVGELDIRSQTGTPGEFDLESNIGDARLSIDGESAGRTEGWLGNSVRHDAGGDDDVSARVNVGEVRVTVR